jgi:glycosyltransferase involved in cell wall biosynthesis
MPNPTISVIMPVYNTGSYLHDSINSILQQTFTDFEFIIINDGSTDNSEEIILSYTDARIRYLKNEKNEGLVYSLNRGIDAARGIFIARMDGDDISELTRLEMQHYYMKQHVRISVLSSFVNLIDNKGNHTGFWKDDKENYTVKAIRTFLPVNNCVAHPTVMIRTELLKEYRYNRNQPLSEDYDLWLRIVSDGGIIDKLPIGLLQHRILSNSFTRTRNINIFFRLMIVKLNFVKERILNRRINMFIMRVLLFSIFDFGKGVGKTLKKFLRR